MIKEFKGEYRWLSNFAPVRIDYGGFTYASVEHAYQAQKSLNTSWKKQCSTKCSQSAGYIKKKSRQIKLRDDWEDVKEKVMFSCLYIKFKQEPYKSKLLATGKEHIQEGNWWNDKFWGVCLKTGIGENSLGRTIMSIRSMLED